MDGIVFVREGGTKGKEFLISACGALGIIAFQHFLARGMTVHSALMRLHHSMIYFGILFTSIVFS